MFSAEVLLFKVSIRMKCEWFIKLCPSNCASANLAWLQVQHHLNCGNEGGKYSLMACHHDECIDAFCWESNEMLKFHAIVEPC